MRERKRSFRNPNRGPNNTTNKEVIYFQHEFGQVTKHYASKYGVTVGHKVYFAKLLRDYDPEPEKNPGNKTMVVYRFFSDKRWDSLVGMVEAMRMYDVSFTLSVDERSRYHIGSALDVSENCKKLINHGKYRSATTNINGVQINTCRWMDSKVCIFASANLGCETDACFCKMGRHNVSISIPRMVKVRSECFREVDQHDQLRLGSVAFDVGTHTKACPKLFFGLLELLVTIMYILACNVTHTSPCSVHHKNLSHREYR